MKSRVLLALLFILGLPANALACGAYPVGTNTSDLVLGLVANGSNLVSYTSIANAGTSRQGMLVYNRTNNTLHLCNGGSWITLSAAAGVSAAGSSGQVQFNNVGVLGADSGLFWDNTNKRLGIGTATPGVALDVNQSGNTGIRTVGTTFGTLIAAAGTVSGLFQADASGYIFAGTSSNHPLSVITNSVERLRILADGKVGIGISTPAGRLDVANIGDVYLSRFTADIFPSALNLRKSRNATVGAHTIVASGDVLGEINFEGSDGTNYDKAAAIKAELDGTPTANSTDMPGRLSFFTSADGSATPTERMRIDNAGNVGIGTTSPNKKLHIVDATGVVGNPTVRLEGATAGYGAGIEAGAPLTGGAYLVMGKLVWDGENSWNTTASTQDSYVTLHTTVDGVLTERFRITSAGNVGIGTTTPGYKVDVVGTINTSGGVRITSISTSGTVTICRDGTAYLTLCSSDERLKKDIKSISGSGLDAILKLRPVNFHWKKDTNQKLDAGFIAQEVQKVIPEAIGVNDTDGMLTFNVTPIVSYTVKAVQELKIANDNLKAVIDEQAASLRNQEAELRDLREAFEAYKAANP